MVVEIKTGTIVRLQGEITPEGSLEVDLPAGLPAGAVEVTLLLSDQPVNGVVANDSSDVDLLTDEQIAALIHPQPVPAHLIQTGGWEHKGITDSVAWLEAQRQRMRANRQ